MATLQELLEDKTKYADTMQITLADGATATLGELRGGFMKDADYRRKTTEVAEQRRALESERARFAQDKASAESQLQALAEQIVQSRGGNTEVTKDEVAEELERNPVAKRIMGAIGKLESKLSEIEKATMTVAQRQEAQRQAEMVGQHRKALDDIRAKDPKFDDQSEAALIDFARRNFVPRLDLAYRLMTEENRWGERLKKEVEDAKKAGIEEGKRNAIVQTIPSRARTFADSLPAEAPKTMDEALDAASRDPEILSIISGS